MTHATSLAGVVIAGTASGTGKTTITTGLIGALRDRGFRVAPFKVGPDYIDPSYHARSAGHPCSNLDSWLLPHNALREVFTRATRDADIAVVEGVMGLYDGRSNEGEAGSTAEVAKLLGLPVILVVDAAKAARSVAAQVLGFQHFDPTLRIAAVILNNVGSANHAALCAEPITASTGLPVLGALIRNDALRLPERYLGLVPTVEGRIADDFFTAATERVATQLDLDHLLHIAAEAHPPSPKPYAESPWPTDPVPARTTIAVARDEAFSFMYPENIDLLEAHGAEIIPFSPLRDTALPAHARGVYIGGGFPELYAEGLAANAQLLASLRDAAARGLPIYAECGGLMYLAETLTAEDGRSHAMAGLLPLRSSMSTTQRRLTLGYRVATAQHNGPHITLGETVRGHEFHWSTLDAPAEPARAAYTLAPDARPDGYASGNIWASYLHLHFASASSLAPCFVETVMPLRARS